MASNRALIFDLDGTLVDSRGDIAAAANHARTELALAPLPLAEVVRFVGDGVEKLIERLTPGEPAARRHTATEAFKEFYARHCADTTRPYPGIIAMLRQVRAAGWRVGVATNKPLAFTQAIIARCAMAPLIDGCQGGDGPRKPDPAQLLTLLTAFAAAPERSWMVGDHHTDIRAGRAAGCRVLWCSWGIGERDGLAVDAEAAEPSAVAGLIDPALAP